MQFQFEKASTNWAMRHLRKMERGGPLENSRRSFLKSRRSFGCVRTVLRKSSLHRQNANAAPVSLDSHVKNRIKKEKMPDGVFWLRFPPSLLHSLSSLSIVFSPVVCPSTIKNRGIFIGFYSLSFEVCFSTIKIKEFAMTLYVSLLPSMTLVCLLFYVPQPSRIAGFLNNAIIVFHYCLLNWQMWKFPLRGDRKSLIQHLGIKVLAI